MPAGILELHLACQKVSCQVNDWDLWMCSQKQSPAQGLCYRNLLHLTSQNRKKQTHLLSKGFSPLTYFTIWGLPAPPSLLLSTCLLASNSKPYLSPCSPGGVNDRAPLTSNRGQYILLFHISFFHCIKKLCWTNLTWVWFYLRFPSLKGVFYSPVLPWYLFMKELMN